ncbi:MAG: hypothetical protein KGJ23_06430 [Euryarchaeota archaeon]|nr:hypothetical protein [Euryarchaeota archaeon]MDE1836237.1 hypothetical protein [Euryarchaeota archaeon]MDE1880890.1 hypothetical protein [Euryarchaeota archaeon]MDE2045002.1 hypothetical protein [Thermoplasmata archaeon]
MTLSAQEAHELALTTPPVSREAAQQVLDYLLYHKALIGESMEAANAVDHYLDLVRGMKEGVHVVIDDPYQKATALLFELVLSEQFNPWSIDLTRFVSVYQDRVKQDHEVDFAVAGRLIHMAWRILLLQSQEVLTQRENELAPPTMEAALPDGALDQGYLGEMSSPEQIDVTEALLRGEDVPIDPMVRHEGTRPVSLMELANAFHEAEESARLFQVTQAERDRLRAWQKTAPEVLAHGDVPEHDLAETWEKVAEHPVGEPFSVELLLEGVPSRERVVSLFLTLLFLAKERVLSLRQVDLSASGFMIEREAVSRRPNGEEAPPPAEEAALASPGA